MYYSSGGVAGFEHESADCLCFFEKCFTTMTPSHATHYYLLAIMLPRAANNES
jgi:hypothetical protein